VKHLVFFTTVLFGLTNSVATLSQNKTAREIHLLTSLGVNDRNHTVSSYLETPFGKYICVQAVHEVVTELDGTKYWGFTTDSFDTYIEFSDTMRSVPILKGYRVYGYSTTKESLIVGKYDSTLVSDSSIEEVYKFELRKERLVHQGTLAGGVYGVRVNGDKMAILLNVKNADGIGSTLTYVLFAIK
jgi:hypothetical protein